MALSWPETGEALYLLITRTKFPTVFINYFKTAFRNLLKNKGFTALNVLGLTLGVATCLLIVFYVLDEVS